MAQSSPAVSQALQHIFARQAVESGRQSTQGVQRQFTASVVAQQSEAGRIVVETPGGQQITLDLKSASEAPDSRSLKLGDLLLYQQLKDGSTLLHKLSGSEIPDFKLNTRHLQLMQQLFDYLGSGWPADASSEQPDKAKTAALFQQLSATLNQTLPASTTQQSWNQLIQQMESAASPQLKDSANAIKQVLQELLSSASLTPGSAQNIADTELTNLAKNSAQMIQQNDFQGVLQQVPLLQNALQGAATPLNPLVQNALYQVLPLLQEFAAFAPIEKDNSINELHRLLISKLSFTAQMSPETPPPAPQDILPGKHLFVVKSWENGILSGQSEHHSLRWNLQNTPWEHIPWQKGDEFIWEKTSSSPSSSGKIQGLLYPESRFLPPELQSILQHSQKPITPHLLESAVFLQDYLTQIRSETPNSQNMQNPAQSNTALPHLSWIEEAARIFYQAESQLPPGKELSFKERDFLVRWMLTQNEAPGTQSIQDALEYQKQAYRDTELFKDLSSASREELRIPDRQLRSLPEMIQKTLALWKTLPADSPDQKVLEQAVKHMNHLQSDQDSRHPQDKQEIMYWMQNNQIQRGGFKVKDQRHEKQESGKDSNRIRFVLDTRTPHLGELSLSFTMENQKARLMIEDDSGRFYENFNSEKPSLEESLQSMGWILENFLYRRKNTSENISKPSPHTTNTQKGWIA
jgi:hypothetical protein